MENEEFIEELHKALGVSESFKYFLLGWVQRHLESMSEEGKESLLRAAREIK